MTVIDKVNRKGVTGKRVLTGPTELVGPRLAVPVRFSSITGITAADDYEITDGSGANAATYTVTVRPYAESGLTSNQRGVGRVALVKQTGGVSDPTVRAAVVASGRVRDTRTPLTIGPVTTTTTDRLFLIVERKDASALKYQLEVDRVLTTP
jgi:hypothetical protein